MSTLRLLFLGDVVGDVGIYAIESALPALKEELAVDFCVVNTENSHQGRGLNERQVRRMFKAGADVQTGGDHSFDKHLIFGYLNNEPNLLRPMNYPKNVPGKGFGIYASASAGVEIGIINLRGLTFFNNPIANPLVVADAAIREISNFTNLIFIDFHAEATAEKLALARYLDGKVSAICGTHTHVQTGDDRVLPGGTGYLTDAGFSGPHDGVIGFDKDVAIDRMLMQIPRKTELATGDARLQGALFELDTETGKCLKITRVDHPVSDEDIKAAEKAHSELVEASGN